MQAHRHVLGIEGLALDDGHVFFLIAGVVKGHDVELAEARRQLGDGRDLHARFCAHGGRGLGSLDRLGPPGGFFMG